MSDSENSFIQSHKKDKEFVDFEDTPLIINDEGSSLFILYSLFKNFFSIFIFFGNILDDEGLNWSRVKQNFTWPVIKKRATYYIPILGFVSLDFNSIFP